MIVTQVIFFAQVGSFLFGFEIGRIKKTPCATIYENILSRLSSQKLPTPTLSVPTASFVSDASEYRDDHSAFDDYTDHTAIEDYHHHYDHYDNHTDIEDFHHHYDHYDNHCDIDDDHFLHQVPSLPTVLPRPAGSGQRPPPQPPARLRHRHHQVRQARQGLHLQPDRQGNGPDQ